MTALLQLYSPTALLFQSPCSRTPRPPGLICGQASNQYGVQALRIFDNGRNSGRGGGQPDSPKGTVTRRQRTRKSETGTFSGGSVLCSFLA